MAPSDQPVTKDLKDAFPGADGIGASFNRDLDAWVLYTTPTCERFGQIDGYDPKRIDAVLKALREALTPPPPVSTERAAVSTTSPEGRL